MAGLDRAVVASIAITSLSIWLTWSPYFREVGMAGVRQASGYSGLTIGERLGAVGETIIGFPVWSLAQYQEYGNRPGVPPFQVDKLILSPTTLSGYEWSLRMIFLQGLLCYFCVVVAAATALIGKKPFSMTLSRDGRDTAWALVLMAAFVILSEAIRPCF